MSTSVFGSTGFIGGRYCQLFPDEVIRIARNSKYPVSGNILYFISTTHNYNVFENPFLDINTNLVWLMNVLNVISPDYTFNFVSSWFVYGDTDLPAKETSECHPKGFYSITKRCAEQLIISYCETFGIRYRIFRLANVYGVGDKDVSDKKNALLFLIDKLSRNEPIELYYGGDFFRDYIHVDDVCYNLHNFIHSAPHNEIINIGSGVPYIFKNLIGYAKDRLGSTSNIITIEPSDFHKIVQVKDMYLDVRKALALGMKNQIRITVGLDEHIEKVKNG